MAFRVFRCDECGHRMRLRGNYCGRCFAPKSVGQRPASLGIIVLVVASLMATLAIVRLA